MESETSHSQMRALHSTPQSACRRQLPVQAVAEGRTDGGPSRQPVGEATEEGHCWRQVGNGGDTALLCPPPLWPPAGAGQVWALTVRSQASPGDGHRRGSGNVPRAACEEWDRQGERPAQGVCPEVGEVESAEGPGRPGRPGGWELSSSGWRAPRPGSTLAPAPRLRGTHPAPPCRVLTPSQRGCKGPPTGALREPRGPPGGQ